MFPGAFLPDDWEEALGQGIGALGTGLDALGERLPSHLYETRAADIFA